MRKTAKQFGNLILAHSDGQSMAAVDGAIIKARRATAIISQK
jgi:hypothetical protein